MQEMMSKDLMMRLRKWTDEFKGFISLKLRFEAFDEVRVLFYVIMGQSPSAKQACMKRNASLFSEKLFSM